MKDGLLDIFIQADCAVSTPTCGPCLGGYMGIMAEGERTVSTTNRNFRGRMGHVDSEVYLASPYVAAASAVLGRIAGLRRFNMDFESKKIWRYGDDVDTECNHSGSLLGDCRLERIGRTCDGRY